MEEPILETTSQQLLENILGRLPSRSITPNLKALSYIAPDGCDIQNLDFTTFPIQMPVPNSDRTFLASRVNKNPPSPDHSNFTFRHPYHPNISLLEGEEKTHFELSTEQKIEIYINEILKNYITQYFDEGHANYYTLSRNEEGRTTEGMFIIRRDAQENKKLLEGRWLTFLKIKLHYDEDKKGGTLSIDSWKDVQVSSASRNFGRFDFDIRRRVKREEIKFCEFYKYMTPEEFEIKHIGKAFEDEENRTYNDVCECDFGVTENVLNKSRKLEHNNQFYKQKIVILGDIFSS